MSILINFENQNGQAYTQKGQLIMCLRAGLGPSVQSIEVPSSSPTVKGCLVPSYLLSSSFTLVESLPNVVHFVLSQASFSRANLALLSLVVTLLNDLLC